MHVTCFIKTIIVTLFNEIDKNKKVVVSIKYQKTQILVACVFKIVIITLSKEIDKNK